MTAATDTVTADALGLLQQALQRQLDELDALELIYPPGDDEDDGSNVRIRIAPDPRALARRAIEDEGQGQGQQGGLLRLWLGDDPELELRPKPLSLTVGRSPSLEIQLPLLYPERGHPPRLRWAEGANRSRAELEAGLLALAEASEAHEEHGGEHLLEIVQAFQELEADRAAAAAAEREREREQQEQAAAAATEALGGPPALLRVLIYFHHIINATKREVVIREALANGLGGYAKIGWPGVVVVEGEEAAVRGYVRRLQGLRWQQITVRGEERVVLEGGQGIDDVRRLHRGFEELGQNDLGVLMRALREAGLGDLGATLMK